jgi:hypothetical protein
MITVLANYHFTDRAMEHIRRRKLAQAHYAGGIAALRLDHLVLPANTCSRHSCRLLSLPVRHQHGSSLTYQLMWPLRSPISLAAETRRAPTRAKDESTIASGFERSNGLYCSLRFGAT